MANNYSRYQLTQYPALYDHLYKKTVNATTGATEYIAEDSSKLTDNNNNAATYLTMWENKKDIVKAEHVIILQDMLYSLQRTLGTNPHISSVTSFPNDPNNPGHAIAGTAIPNLSTRLKCIESIIPDDVHINSLVNAHVHGKNGLKTVSLDPLAGEISGKLSADNVITDIANIKSVSANTLYYGTSTTIKAAIDSKLSTTGGTITGALTVNAPLSLSGTLKSRSIVELSVADFNMGSGGNIGNKNGMDGDKCISNRYTNQTLGEVELINARFDALRYNKYTACIRVYFNKGTATMPTINDTVFSVYVGTSGNGIQKVVRFTGKQISNQTYFNDRFRTFYVTFDLGGTTGDVKDKIIKITYPSNNPYQIACDGIVIAPAHTAVL